MLEINNLTKKFGEKIAVDNLSLKVENGQICAFIGHNGAGKTTTLKAIAGIIDFDDGEIFVDNFSLRTNSFEVKKNLAYVPDNPQLYENLKGIEFLNFISDVFELNEKERQQQIENFSKRFEIYDNLGEVISSYSHGMKQKLVLVSALIHKPKLLLLDEPFVGLDPVSSHEFKLIMKELASKGVTIFYSTHVLDVAEKICSHVAIIKNGKLIAHDTMTKITSDNSLENIFLELENEKHN